MIWAFYVLAFLFKFEAGHDSGSLKLDKIELRDESEIRNRFVIIFFSFIHHTYVEVLEDSEHRGEEGIFLALTEISLVEKINQ